MEAQAGNFIKKKKNAICISKVKIPLSCKLVPVQSREYDYGILGTMTTIIIYPFRPPTPLLLLLVSKRRSFINFLCNFLLIYYQLLFKPSTWFQNQSFHNRDFHTYVIVLEIVPPGSCLYCGRQVSHNALVFSRSIGSIGRRATSFSQRSLVELHRYRATIRGSKWRLFHVFCGLSAAYCGCAPDNKNLAVISTVLEDKQEKILAPAASKVDVKTGWYSLEGYTSSSPVLVFCVPKKRGAEGAAVMIRSGLRLWYGEDLKGYTESDNGGRTCADVYGLLA